MSCGIGHRCGLDLVLLWLWGRPAAAALIQLLAWEPPYAAGVALKSKSKKKKKREREREKEKVGSERANHLLEVTELVSSKAGF